MRTITHWYHSAWIRWLLESYVLARFKVISGWVQTCGSAHLWRLYGAAPLGEQTVMTWYPTQLHYPGPEPTNPCPIIIMLSVWLRTDKYNIVMLLVWLDQSSKLCFRIHWFLKRGIGRLTHSAIPSDIPSWLHIRSFYDVNSIKFNLSVNLLDEVHINDWYVGDIV